MARAFTISNLYIKGLFGYVGTGGEVQNLGLFNAGGLVGWNSGTIENCYATGNVTGIGYTGGLVGWNSGTIRNCYATAEVTGTGYTGGLVGENNGGTITNCYAIGNVTGTGSRYASVGGLVGYNGGTISDCYAAGNVSATGSGNVQVGGLVGYNGHGDTISNCYATGNVSATDSGTASIGGLVGSSSSFRRITNCYFSSETAGLTAGIGGTRAVQTGVRSLSAARLKSFTPSSWSTKNWDFGNTSQYPALRRYKESEESQVQGDLFCGQPAPRMTCLFVPNGEGIFEIATIEDLNRVQSNLAGHYVLTANLGFTEPSSYASGSVNAAYGPAGGDPATATNAGWTPIGDNTNTFTGTFDGRGFTISNLYINNATTNYAGLFGSVGTGGVVQDLGLLNIHVTGTGSYSSIMHAGGLVGENNGTIRNCYATGEVIGAGRDDVLAGGLVGENNGTISNCYATGEVTGIGRDDVLAGGLVGENSSIISNCYATGDVTGTGTVVNFGGFMGSNGFRGTI